MNEEMFRELECRLNDLDELTWKLHCEAMEAPCEAGTGITFCTLCGSSDHMRSQCECRRGPKGRKGPTGPICSGASRDESIQSYVQSISRELESILEEIRSIRGNTGPTG